MNPSNTTTLNTAPIHKDIAEQAHPGHGIPSQDPASSAQFPLNTAEADREANSVLTGGGMVAGAATGVAIGAVAAGPLGVLVGGSLGAVVGAIGAQAAGAAVRLADAARADTTPVQNGHQLAHSAVSDRGGQAVEAMARPTASMDLTGEHSTDDLDNLGKDFGAFYPRGHVVVAFKTKAELEQAALGLKDVRPSTTPPIEITSSQMIEFAERNIQEAGVMATLGTSITTLQGFLDAARQGAVFLIVPSPDDETAERVTLLLRDGPYL